MTGTKGKDPRLQGEREGANAVVESEGHRLGGGENKGGGGEIDGTSGSGSSTDGEEELKEEREDKSKASGSSGAEWSGASADE